MVYEIVPSLDIFVIKRVNIDKSVSFIPFDETNSDYQQYLEDTNGGIDIPESDA